MKKILYIFVIGLIISSCTVKTALNKDAYQNLYAEKPLTILILPPINNSITVEAKDLLYGSLSSELIKRGYYVIPALITMDVLKKAETYDSKLFEHNSMKRVGEHYGADAVLFTTIHEWGTHDWHDWGNLLRVKIEYTIKSTKTDEILFHRIGTVSYTPRTSVTAFGTGTNRTISTSTTSAGNFKEIMIAYWCNNWALYTLPAGKYSPEYGLDQEKHSGEETFKENLSF